MYAAGSAIPAKFPATGAAGGSTDPVMKDILISFEN
jgi:hypothetical protein